MRGLLIWLLKHSLQIFSIYFHSFKNASVYRHIVPIEASKCMLIYWKILEEKMKSTRGSWGTYFASIYTYAELDSSAKHAFS